ncbi:MAG: MFS transporter [Firmicutes bacterium]|nr:MFS transporter [Bacillota bacterium]
MALLINWPKNALLDPVLDKIKTSQIFASLKRRNFRLFWTGQCISLIGTWMQNVAQAWLVLELTKSAFWLGVVNAIQFLPILFFSLYAGTIIDRFSKRRILIFTQILMMILALILAVDTLLHTVVLWHVLIIAGLLGLSNCLDMPTRQSFLVELVGSGDLRNAIILNSAIFNAARVLGPSIAGIVIARVGTGTCFLINGISFIPVITGIVMIKPVIPSATPTDLVLLEKTPPVPKFIQPLQNPGALTEILAGLRFVAKAPVILSTVILMAFLNVFTFNFNVLIPLFAKNVFCGDAQLFGFLMTAIGTGALLGTLVLAANSRKPPKTRTVAFAAIAICVFELLITPVKSYYLAYLILFVVGISMITYSTTSNALIQTQTPHHLRGRVMSIYTLVFAGFSPFGSFFSGFIAHQWGAPFALGLGAVTGLVAVIVLLIRFPKVFSII